MYEWGLISNYHDYLRLPEPVKIAWRLAAEAEADAYTRRKPGSMTQPTQNLLQQELDRVEAEKASAADR